jgi:hypothetical protein
MIPCDYTSENGRKVTFDLDAVIDVAIGYSKKRQGWTATLIYIPESSAFVELRSAPQDIRGNSKEEAEEVSFAYIGETFAIDNEGLNRVKSDPGNWQLINRRTGA